MKRLSYIGIAVSILCSFQVSSISKATAETCSDVANGCLKINVKALSTLIPTSKIVSEEEARQQGSNGEVSSLSSPPSPKLTETPPNINKQVTQDIQDLWQLKVPKGSIVEPTYTCANDNLTYSDQSIPVVAIKPIPSDNREPSGANDEIVQGGATIIFNISNNLKAGNYACNLHIDVKVTPPT